VSVSIAGGPKRNHHGSDSCVSVSIVGDQAEAKA
jgi:hypothetical protein